MSSESEFLLATLRGAGAPAPQSIDWQVLLKLADSHGVLPLFCKKYSGELPETFASGVRSQWTTSAFLACELQGILKHFCLHGVEVLPLKGPLLAQVLYGSAGLRPCDDLDLLVRPADFIRATSLLLELGFEPVDQPDDYHQAFQRRDTCVELHFSIAPPSSPAMDLDRVWDRAPMASFRGQRARFFAKPDLLIYLIIHGVKHEFARLIWVLDAARALAELDDDELNEALKRAQAIGIGGAFLCACELARYSLHIALPAPVVAAIAREPGISAQAQVLWEKILAGPADPGTAHQGAGLLVQLEPRARHRWAHRLRLFLPSQQDRLWAQRHNIAPHCMLLLRPLRLLSKHGPGPAWRTLFPRVEAKPPLS